MGRIRDNDYGDDGLREDAKDPEVNGSKVEDEIDEDDIADIEEDLAMVTGTHDDEADDTPSEAPSTLHELVQRATPEIIFLINLSGQSEEYRQLQASELSALNNMAWSVSCFNFSMDENASILKVWEPAGRWIGRMLSGQSWLPALPTSNLPIR